jgi:hypothetical protein
VFAQFFHIRPWEWSQLTWGDMDALIDAADKMLDRQEDPE